jgi:hypothetical protein
LDALLYAFVGHMLCAEAGERRDAKERVRHGATDAKSSHEAITLR